MATSDGREMTCAEVQPLVRQATRGTLGGASGDGVGHHLATCVACRALADEEGALDRLLEEELPQYAAPLALKRRLQARLPSIDEPPARRRRAVVTWGASLTMAFAAAALLFVLVRGRLPSPGGTLVAEAVADHLRVIYRDRPVDIESGGPHQVKPWFTGRLDFAIPTVFGGNDEFVLVGGSVGYYLDRQAAVLVYKRQLHTISVLVFRAGGLSIPTGEQPLGRVSASVRQARGFSVVLWRDGELGYALVSDLNAQDLLRLGAAVANGS
jgi:anti-sigma factor RsiW